MPLSDFISDSITSLSIRFNRFYNKVRLNNKKFTIISNNCWGGLIYNKLGLEYQSPTIGCGIMDEHYFKLCENLNHYFAQKLEFIDPHQSIYYDIRRKRYKKEIDYPVARLDDIEIWFTHYKSKNEAKEKWERRLKRMNPNKIIIKWSQRNSMDEAFVKRFLALPHANKIAFVAPGCKISDKSIIVIPELEMLNRQGGDETPPSSTLTS